MNILQIAVTALLLSFLSFSMREAGVKGASLVLLGAGLLILFPVVDRLSSLLSFWKKFANASSSAPHVATIMKVLGIGYLSHFAADSCRESGAAVLASRVELCGKLEILLVCMPYLQEILSYAMSVSES